MQKMKQFRRLKLEEVKVLAEEGIELKATEYQQQVEKREAQRRKEREERLAREAMMTLKAMEQEEQKAAETAAKEAETLTVQGEDDGNSDKMKLLLSLRCFISLPPPFCLTRTRTRTWGKTSEPDRKYRQQKAQEAEEGPGYPHVHHWIWKGVRTVCYS